MPIGGIDVMLVIDVLASGGAQRQLCELAAILKEHGLTVHVVTYHPGDFYMDFLSQRGIGFTVSYHSVSRVRRLWMVWSAILRMHPRVVCAFLTGPSLMVELARLCRVGDFRLAVSERHSDERLSWRTRSRLMMHALSDRVVVNSAAQERFIGSRAPWLAGKLVCIRNCVDLARFSPSDNKAACSKIRLAVVGSYTRRKNSFGMLRGFRKFLDAHGPDAATLEWYGNKANLAEVYQATNRLCSKLHLSGSVKMHDQVEQIERIYAETDALCLPSFSEATPNVICEGMAAGLPIVASRVGDVPDIVVEGENGFLFDPSEPESIAHALGSLQSLSLQERNEMGRRNRRRAAQLFGRKQFAEDWIRVLVGDRPQ